MSKIILALLFSKLFLGSRVQDKVWIDSFVNRLSKNNEFGGAKKTTGTH